MRERAVLAVAVIVLFGGMSVWAMVAQRADPILARALLRPPTPSIGEPVAADDSAAAPARAMLAGAMLGGFPLARLFERAATPIDAVVVPGRDAIAVRDRMAEVEAVRLVPIVLGDGWSTREHARAVATTGDSPDAIVTRARGIDVDAWLAVRTASLDVGEASSSAHAPPRERWSTVRDPELDAWLPEVAIAMLPTDDVVEAPAWLAFGNWHGCPDPTLHVAMLTRWRAQFGAELIAIDEDTIELRVARPPMDAASALAVAREHAAYAPSLVGAHRSVSDLAADLVGAPIWTFRWPRVTTH